MPERTLEERVKELEEAVRRLEVLVYAVPVIDYPEGRVLGHFC